MKIFIDIDETICYYNGSRSYEKALPLEDNIKKANMLFDKGHEITYWTARGTITGIDWREVTEEQFKRWGVKYHKLMFGKPAYDLMIDDRTITNFETLSQITHFNDA